MFSLAKNFVRALEHTAESVISGGPQDDSILDSDSYFTNIKYNKYGLRILSVKSDSPGAKAGLESWFDYVIGINGHEIPTGYDDQHQLVVNYEYLIREIENCKGRSVAFEVWSAKGGILKSVQIEIKEFASSQLDEIPLNQNPNVISQQSFEKLGISFQWTPLITSTFVYHILEIHPNSPAERAGLIEHSDYIVGAQDGLLATGGEDLLGRLITSKKNTTLVLYVYNHDYDIVRPVSIVPVESAEGNGLLGCGVGYGLLHRLPTVTGNMAPGTVLFDGSNQSYNTPNMSQESFHVLNQPPTFKSASPAPVQPSPLTTSQPTTGIAPPPIHSRKKKVANADNKDLLSYIQEESAKSRELDHEGRPKSATNSAVPPPPKK